jgi:hypothetical protein
MSKHPLPLDERLNELFRRTNARLGALERRTLPLESGCQVVAYVGTIPSSYVSGDPTVVLASGTVLGPCRYVTTYTPAANATVLAVPAGQEYIVVGALA